MGDVLPPKRQTVVERLKRRFHLYRSHQNACLPRYEQAANGLYESQRQETVLLKQRFLESKAKKAKTKTDHHRTCKDTTSDSSKSQLHPKPLKRNAEESIPNLAAPETVHNEDGEKPAKLARAEDQSTMPDLSSKPQASLPAFSVQIVQQFNQTPQVIKPNVTVQTLQPASNRNNQKMQQEQAQVSLPDSPPVISIINPTPNPVECKQEKDSLDSDLCPFKNGPANNNNSVSSGGDRLSDPFPSIEFTDESGENVLHPDILNDLIEDVFTNSNGDIMKDFNFEDSVGSLKDTEDVAKDIIELVKASSPRHMRGFSTENLPFANTSLNSHQQNDLFRSLPSTNESSINPLTPNTSTPVSTSASFFNASSQRLPSYGNASLSISNGLGLDFEPSPAALTLKQMAEQHQNMQQKHQQQLANPSLSNRTQPFNQQNNYPNHMNQLRSANFLNGAASSAIQSHSPKMLNSGGTMFSAFDQRINTFQNTESSPSFQTNFDSMSPNNMFDSRTTALSDADMRALQMKLGGHQSMDQQKLGGHQLMDQQKLGAHQLMDQQKLGGHQLMDQQKLGGHQLMDQQKHQAMEQQKLAGQQAMEQMKLSGHQVAEQPKPPAYGSTRPLAHFPDNTNVRHKGHMTSQQQHRPMGRQFPANSAARMGLTPIQQHMQMPRQHTPQQFQQDPQEMKLQQQHTMMQQNQNMYGSYSSQQNINNNPSFHVTMSQSLTYSNPFPTTAPVNRPPPEYKPPNHYRNMPPDNMQLVDQLSAQPQQTLYNAPANRSKMAKQRSPNVTITPDGSAVSSHDWRNNMMNNQQQQQNQYRMGSFNTQENYNDINSMSLPSNIPLSPMYSQYRMPNNQIPMNRTANPNQLPFNNVMTRQRMNIPQHSRLPAMTPMEQHTNMTISNHPMPNTNVMGSMFNEQQDMDRQDGSQLNFDFLDNIESSASDLLNFDQVIQGGSHFPILDDMDLLNK